MEKGYATDLDDVLAKSVQYSYHGLAMNVERKFLISGILMSLKFLKDLRRRRSM
jgi:hypothetical protein